MTPRFDEPLAGKTTLGIGGPARFFIYAEHDDEVAVAAAFARAHDLPLRVLGAGSNVLVPDGGIDAVVLQLASSGISFSDESEEAVLVTAGAGVRWDVLVDAAVARGLYGIENLAGVPGTVGGAAVQNIGAYGAAFSSVFAYAETYDLDARAIVRVEAGAVAFGYRMSSFKRSGKQVLLRVTLRLLRAGALQLGYPDVAARRAQGERIETPSEAASAIRAIRAAKFPAPEIAGTAGSFFGNPVLDSARARAIAERFPGMPLFALPEGGVKVPIAWLMDYRHGVMDLRNARVGGAYVWPKQALVIVTEPRARARDVDALADMIAQRVYDATRMRIEREVETFAAQILFNRA